MGLGNLCRLWVWVLTGMGMGHDEGTHGPHPIHHHMYRMLKYTHKLHHHIDCGTWRYIYKLIYINIIYVLRGGQSPREATKGMALIYVHYVVTCLCK
jgi:hypothetical protein